MSGSPPEPPPIPVASEITITPVTGMKATNVQQAIEELQGSKRNYVVSNRVSGTGSVRANPNVPHVDQPQADPASLRTVLTQVRQGVESLGGHRGAMLDRAVTLQDLVDLNLVSAADIYGQLPLVSPGGPTPPPPSPLRTRRVR